MYNKNIMDSDDIMIFSGSGSRKLTDKICDYLDIKPARNETLKFSEGSTFVRVLENVRGRQVYIVQSTIFPVNDNFMELLFWIDALKRASAESVTVVMPFFGYGKGDKKDEPRVSIRGRVCADAIEAAGADRIVTMDLHAPQIQGFFHIPVDNLYAMPTLCNHIKAQNFDDLIVIAPDAGFAKQARKYAAYLGTGIAIADKQRLAHDEKTETMLIIGDVKNKTAVIVDDFTITGGTLAEAAKKLMEQGAKEVYAMVTHGVFTTGSMEKIDASPLKKIFITDTVENHPIPLSDKIEIISAAPLFGEAIKRIHNRESISVMFS